MPEYVHLKILCVYCITHRRCAPLHWKMLETPTLNINCSQLSHSYQICYVEMNLILIQCCVYCADVPLTKNDRNVCLPKQYQRINWAGPLIYRKTVVSNKSNDTSIFQFYVWHLQYYLYDGPRPATTFISIFIVCIHFMLDALAALPIQYAVNNSVLAMVFFGGIKVITLGVSYCNESQPL